MPRTVRTKKLLVLFRSPRTWRISVNRCCIAQYIVDDEFDPVFIEGEFGKESLDAEFVRGREVLVTRGWQRLQKLKDSDLPILEYPLPEVVERIKQSSGG